MLDSTHLRYLEEELWAVGDMAKALEVLKELPPSLQDEKVILAIELRMVRKLAETARRTDNIIATSPHEGEKGEKDGD